MGFKVRRPGTEVRHVLDEDDDGNQLVAVYRTPDRQLALEVLSAIAGDVETTEEIDRRYRKAIGLLLVRLEGGEDDDGNELAVGLNSDGALSEETADALARYLDPMMTRCIDMACCTRARAVDRKN